MPLLDSVPVTSCHECVAMLTLPLALFLLLAETAVGGFVTVAYLRLTGGLTHGFLKFIAVTYAILGSLAFLVVLAIPSGAYRRLLSINPSVAGALIFLQGLLVVALVVHAVVIWRQDGSRLSWVLTLSASLLLLAGIAAALLPLAGSLLRAIGVLLVGLVLQAILFPLTLRGLAHGSGSLTHPLTLSPVLSVLWGLGAVLLPLVAAALALPTCRLRSFMSTTGLLYLAMIAILPGQLLGQLLFFVAASA